MRRYALRCGLLIASLVVAAGSVQAARVLSDSELLSVRGSAQPPQGCQCTSIPCVPNPCGWDPERKLCVQKDNGGNPNASCTKDGSNPTCCTTTTQDCYREKTLSPVEPGNCTWACEHRDSDNWGQWSGWMGDRKHHCRYTDCPQNECQ